MNKDKVTVLVTHAVLCRLCQRYVGELKVRQGTHLYRCQCGLELPSFLMPAWGARLDDGSTFTPTPSLGDEEPLFTRFCSRCWAMVRSKGYNTCLYCRHAVQLTPAQSVARKRLIVAAKAAKGVLHDTRSVPILSEDLRPSGAAGAATELHPPPGRGYGEGRPDAHQPHGGGL